ncbi:MAG: hypothetical protein QM747_20370 [Nocardioides sp.]
MEIVDGVVRRCFARSASLHNLVLFHDVFAGDIFTDFPFIEASFGLGYAGVSDVRSHGHVSRPGHCAGCATAS